MIDIDPIDKTLGNNLRFLRLMRGLTQSEVGKILGVTFQQVQKYEQGNNRISARTLCKLRHVFHVEYQDFFTPIRDHPIPATDNEQDKLIISAVRHLSAIPSLQKKRTIVSIIKELAKE